ncbi:MAG: HAD family hydrolase [Thermoprotei archaeon]|jgi:putative hydrolase of the HAD superfamily
MEPKAIAFDAYGTLFQIETDEQDRRLFEGFSRWLELNEVHLDPDFLASSYKAEFEKRLKTGYARGLRYPEADVRDVMEAVIGPSARRRFIEEACLVFRALSIKRFGLRKGVEQVLKDLKGPLALISNAQAAFTWAELRTYGLHRLFDVIVLSSEVGFKKPDPMIFDVALARLGLLDHRGEVVYVGDTYETDVVGAKGAGMKAVLIGRPSAEHKVKPDAYLDPERFDTLSSVIRDL